MSGPRRRLLLLLRRRVLALSSSAAAAASWRPLKARESTEIASGVERLLVAASKATAAPPISVEALCPDAVAALVRPKRY
jgi:hypothetical protein